MTKPTQQQAFDDLLAKFEPEIAAAFRTAIADIRSRANLAKVIEALSTGDMPGALDALYIEEPAFAAVVEAIRASYTAGGNAGVATMQRIDDRDGRAVVIRFDGRNARAEAWLTGHSSDLVTQIVSDQRNAIRTALNEGMVRGAHPRTVALDVVGRIDRATGRRQGGVIGLTSQQEEYSRTAAQELASGDTAAMRNYLTRARRDKRFDRSVTKAIREGAKIPADTAGKAVTGYRNRLLQLRGEMIGRTEALTSLRAAKHESYLQAVGRGSVTARSIRRTWRDAGDLRVRHTHVGLNGETVGLTEAFKSPSGALLLFPGDTSLGASASEVIGCRCDVDYRIDFLANLD